MERVNTTLFLFINGFTGNAFWDAINCFIATISPYFYALFLVGCYLKGKRNRALYAFYSALVGLSINVVITIFYFHPRPFMLGLGQTLIRHSPESSFPSDHATLAFSIAFFFLLDKDLKIGAILLLVALLTGFARVYVGVHFPFDIVGSLVVSLVASIFVIILKEYLSKLNSLLNNSYDKVMALLLKRG
jgi:undecaprenyl-diphosphatase